MVASFINSVIGASKEFNSVASKFEQIKKLLQAGKEDDIAAFIAKVEPELKDIESKIKGFLNELSDVADISFISELTNFLGLPAGSQASLNALSSLTSQFGSGLSGAGQDLGSLVSLARAAFSGDVNSLIGVIPNFVKGPDGAVKAKPDNSGMPEKNPVGESTGNLSTPSAQIALVNNVIANALTLAAIEVTKNLPTTTLSSESGDLSSAARKEFDKQTALNEAINVKNKIAPSPQVQKMINATSTNSTLPPKAPLISPDEILEQLKAFQERVTVAHTNIASSFTRTSTLFVKSTRDFPYNILANEKMIVRNDKKKYSLEGKLLGLESESPSSSKKFLTSRIRSIIPSKKFANNAIRNAIQFHSRAQTESSKQALIGGVESRVIEFEKLSASFVEVSDKMFDELEKTYAIDSQ
jgi:hypothetical protein